MPCSGAPTGLHTNWVFSDQRSSTDTANTNYTDKVTLPAAGGASSALRQASGFTNDNKRAAMSGRPSLLLMKHRESAGGAKVCSSRRAHTVHVFAVDRN